MKNFLIPISIGLMCTSFTVNHNINPASGSKLLPAIKIYGAEVPVTENTAAALYEAISLKQYGLSEEAFQYAWKGYEKLLQQKRINRNNYLTICDFSQHSSNKRMYIIDIANRELIKNTYVAHGKNSGQEYANSFSNTPESLQSSLGFYITDETYTGKHGLSLRLKGVEAGINNNAYERTIVMHGANYVDAARANAGVMMGRSFGCPAVPQNESGEIINTIKNGSCLFIYHPNRNYLQYSKILND